MSEEENYILASEAASAGKIVFSKIGKNLKTEKEAQMEEKESIAKAEESISKVLAHINIALKQIKCERVIEEKDCLCKNWDTLTKADFQDLMSAGYTPENYQKLDFEQDSVFESLYFLNKKISVENMKKAGERALNQIEEMRYADGMYAQGYQKVIKYGAAFYRKSCLIGRCEE